MKHFTAHQLAVPLLAISFAWGGAASAVPVTLEMNAPHWVRERGQQVDGYQFTYTRGDAFVGSSGNCYPACAHNGGNYLISSGALIDLAPVGGASFSLLRFDAAETHIGSPSIWAESILVTGQLAGGGSVTAQFALDGINDGTGPLNDFQTFTLPGNFVNLSSVRFEGTGHFMRQFAMDNFVVGGSSFTALAAVQNTRVPEPRSSMLVAVALLSAAAVQLLQARRPPSVKPDQS